MCIFFQIQNAFSQINQFEVNKNGFSKFEVTNLAGNGLITSYKKFPDMDQINFGSQRDTVFTKNRVPALKIGKLTDEYISVLFAGLVLGRAAQ